MNAVQCPRCRKATPPGARCSWCRAPLVAPNKARRTDPETAHKGAEISNAGRGKLDQEILRALEERGDKGFTTHECALEIDRKHNNISGRFVHLERAGLIHRTGFTRPSQVPPDEYTGVKCIVWYFGRRQPRQESLL